MLTRFCLYGFLKNQRYFEAFFMLYLLQLQCTFTEIGIIIAVRELLLNIFEIPSGALADMYGRRRCMSFSFIAYCIAFVILAMATNAWICLLAMLPLAMGDAFRTGTHKAIIFSWLKQEGREDEKQAVYGITRSWSKIGSAVSIPIATVLVLCFEDYRLLFWCSLLPYALDLINVMTYPKSLDAERDFDVSLRDVIKRSFKVLKQCIVFKPLRRLLCESMAFEGVFKANKDYLQVMLLTAAVSMPAFLESSVDQRTAIIVGFIYVCIYLLSAVASRQSDAVCKYFGGEHLAARKIWLLNLIIYSIIGILLFKALYIAAACVFIGVHIIQNIWRPLIIARFDEVGQEREAATLLSVESQSRSFACMLIAPAVGYAVDYAQVHHIGGLYWPVAAVAVLASLWILIWYR